MDVRRAGASDARAIAQIHVESWRAGYVGLMPDEVLASLSVDERAGHWRSRLADPGSGLVTFVVEADAEVVGFCSLALPARDPDTPQAAELAALYVSPRRWRRGVGRTLIQAATSAMSEEGYREAILWLLTGNRPGLEFYSALGWTRDGTTRVREEFGAEEMRLRRPLPGEAPE